MVKIKATASGKEYSLNKLMPGELQYPDRTYIFAYIPDELLGCQHIMTHGWDKMISEDDWCFTIEVDHPCEVYILYPDKQPVLPHWMAEYTRTRLNVTRTDSNFMNLKGYFSAYKQTFPAGEIVFGGNSPNCMLAQDFYGNHKGANYCMYTVVIKEL